MSMQTAAGHLPLFAGPLYVQVATILRNKICASEWSVRMPLPNEVTLAREIGVSIGTVRKALEMLENERLIERRQGRGTFVVETSVESELERFSNIMFGSKKLRAQSVSWSCVTGYAAADESQILHLALGARVFRLHASWIAGEAAATVENITVSEARFPGLPDHLAEGGQFLFPIYRRHYREPIGKVTETLTCLNADATVASILNVPEQRALMQICRVAYALSGGPIEWSRRIMDLGQSQYTVTMA